MNFETLKKYPNIRHLITQKEMDCGCKFSLAMHTGENIKQISENRNKIEKYFGENSIYCSLMQVHSSEVYIFAGDKSLGWKSIDNAIEADAVITNQRGVVLSILTADCVPILLYDPIAEVVGAVHAGWKGSSENILGKSIDKMIKHYRSNPKDIIVAIGAAIGGCCYEVGNDVAEHFLYFDEKVLWQSKERGKYKLDLKRVNKIQAEEAGVPSSQIELSDICTSCNKQDYFSYRGEHGCSGRFMSAISLI